jgi:hypothetical protein
MGVILVFVKIAIAQLLPIIISYFNNPKYDKNDEFLKEYARNNNPFQEDGSHASTPIIKRRPLGSNTSESFVYDSEVSKPTKGAKKKAQAAGRHRGTGVFGDGAQDASSDASKDFQLDSQGGSQYDK